MNFNEMDFTQSGGWPRTMSHQNGISNSEGQNFMGMPPLMPGPAAGFMNNSAGGPSPGMCMPYVFKCPECSLQKHSTEDLEV